MRCPGQDMKYWRADAIFDVPCPQCGSTVEFYKDDSSRRCGNCDHRFVNPHLDFGCAAYCRFAEQCLGTLPEDFTGSGTKLFKERLAVRVKKYFSADFKKIREASQAARFAEKIGKEEGVPLVALLCAAYLHAIPATTTTTLLKELGAEATLCSEIFALLAGQERPDDDSPMAVKCLHDALTLAGAPREGRRVSAHFFTDSAAHLATERAD